jgi:hypothetical protein
MRNITKKNMCYEKLKYDHLLLSNKVELNQGNSFYIKLKFVHYLSKKKIVYY